MRILNYRRRIFGALGVGIMAFACIFTPGPTVSALTQGNHDSTPNSHRARCTNSPYPNYPDISLAIPESSISLNLSNGHVSYTAVVKYQQCGSDKPTRAYAIYGASFCPGVGNYVNGGATAYDCAKYIGNPAYSTPGSTLSCPQGTNDSCLYNGRNLAARNYWISRGNLVTATSPGSGTVTTDGNNTSLGETALDLNVPNWSTRKLSDGSYTFDLPGKVCQYYKYGGSPWSSDTNGDAGRQRCVDSGAITVRWNTQWDVDPSTTMTVNGVQRTNDPSSPFTVNVGDTVVWDHVIKNMGPDRTDQAVTWRLDQDVQPTVGTTTLQSGVWGSGQTSGAVLVRSSTKTITAADAGKRFCQRIVNQPNSYNTASAEGSAWRCIQIPPPYDLNPSISTLPRTYAYDPVVLKDVQGWVDSTNPGAAGSHLWQVWMVKYSNNPGTRSLTDATDPDASCPPLLAPGAVATTCKRVFERTDSTWTANSGIINSSQFAIPAGSTDPVGTRTCFVTRVKNPTNLPGDDTSWRYSTFNCSVSAKRPTVHIRGSDLRVMGGIDAGISEVSSKYYGSWVEYGVFSVNPNEIASSGAGLRGGDISSAKADWSKLTFTNTTSTLAGYAGGYGPLSVSTSRNYFANLPATNPAAPPLSGSVDMASLASGIYDATSGVSLYGAVGTGKSIILRTAGTITIADSITIPNSYASVSDISQVVIVAQDINITGGASDKTIDAWLLAAGNINTCAEKAVADPLTASDCPSRLTVNGPVIADKLYLRRTAGAEYNAPQDPAEVFNLRASSYLWIYNYANAKERTQTTFVRELPPRF